ncbi:MAG: hypothetical protein JXR25_09500 [Pontiellaceae bacterium]|nr:hypothetical protein [Pontiellaceae bacterium]MBN2785051.1 hypothetical protein [Pontiellaceae bacterium]
MKQIQPLWVLIALLTSWSGAFAHDVRVTIDRFAALDLSDPAKVLNRYNGNTAGYEGFYLSAVSNGITAGRLSTDYLRNWSAGFGVNILGFTRSINNNGTTAEAIDLYISPEAESKGYQGLTGLETAGSASTVVIDGFISDPQASSDNGTVNYAANQLTWTQSVSGGRLSFSNPAAAPAGVTLRISNGSTTGDDDQFGLLAFSYSSSVSPVTLPVARFLQLDPADPTKTLYQYNGNMAACDGFYLSALSNGVNNAQLATDYLKDWNAGIGVDTLGFTRSINNDGSTVESVDFHISADAAKGGYGGLTGLETAGAASIVVIDGFASDPQASSGNGTVSYASNRVVWTQSTVGSTLSFANAAATPAGTTLRISNGSTSGTANQFGIRSFSYMASYYDAGLAALNRINPSLIELSWYGERGTDYRLEHCENLATGDWSRVTGRINGSGCRQAITNLIDSTAEFFRVVPDDSVMILGANVNESGRALDIPLLDQSRSEWVRTFFAIKPFYNGTRNLADDLDLETVKKAVRSGRKLVLCLKWNFDSETFRVPAPDSALEAKCFQWVDDLMGELDGMVSVLETVNEIMIDTYADDMLPGTDGVIPMVRFLQRFIEHVSARNYTTPEGTPLPLYSGGFTRLFDPNVRRRPSYPVLLSWIENDDRVTGVNFHIHASDLSNFQESYDFLRQTVPSKPAIVTEFSLVWKYKQNLEYPLDTWSEGSGFASQYGYDENMIVRDYVNMAITHSVSETEWNAFLRAMPWYDTEFLGKACEVMQSNGTVLATFAFQQASSGGRTLDKGDDPWILNPILVNYVATNGIPPEAVNKGFFWNYLNW